MTEVSEIRTWDDPVLGMTVRKYTLRLYSFFFKEIEAKSAEFSTPS